MVSFRYAEAADCALILQFIKELAEYEKALDLVVATEALLDEWLFKRKRAEVIFAVENGIEVGFAMFFCSFPAGFGRAGLYLENLYVKPKYHRLGYGKALMRQLAGIALERGYSRLEWLCLDWNQSAIGFYSSLGAKLSKTCLTFRMDEATFTRLAAEP